MSAHTKKAFRAPHRRCGHVEGGVRVILLVQFFVLSLMVLIFCSQSDGVDFCSQSDGVDLCSQSVGDDFCSQSDGEDFLFLSLLFAVFGWRPKNGHFFAAVFWPPISVKRGEAQLSGLTPVGQNSRPENGHTFGDTTGKATF